MLALFQDLKSQMNKLRDGEREKLTKLTLESNAAAKEVKRHQDKVKLQYTCSNMSMCMYETC